MRIFSLEVVLCQQLVSMFTIWKLGGSVGIEKCFCQGLFESRAAGSKACARDKFLGVFLIAFSACLVCELG